MQPMKDMPYHYGLHMRIYPSIQQKKIIKQNIDAARFVYNRCVAVGRELYRLRKVKTYLEPVVKRMHFLETEYCDVKQISNLAPFLNTEDIDAQAKANAVQNYRKAWKQFKAVPKSGIPTFHKKSYAGSYQTNAHYSSDDYSVMDGTGVRFLDDSHVVLPKVGRIRVKGSKHIIKKLLVRTTDTRIGTVTVSKESDGKYYVSMQLGSTEPFVKVLGKTGASVGIDVNLKNFCADSDGNEISNPRYKHSLQDKLAKNQRRLSRMACCAKQEGRELWKSKNYQKQRIKTAALQKHISNQRKDFLHVLSKRYVENQDIIGIEDLKVSNLLKNHNVAYAISDVSWRMFRTFLEYKADLYEKVVIAVAPQFTSQTCSACGYVLQPEERLTLRERDWTCPECGTHHRRDNNAAENIRQRAVDIYLETV